MKGAENQTDFVLPSNKFYPPHIDDSQSLLRSGLLNDKFPSLGQHKKVIIVEAQAGQGKTTIVSQYLKSNNLTYTWYQIGPEDSDPVLLISSLIINLENNLSGFQCNKLKRILSEGTIGPLDLSLCVDLLYADLNSYLEKDIHLVFDDLHRIEFTTLSNSLFEYLIDTAPPHVYFILITRHPLEIKGKTVRNGNQIAYLNTSDLALNNSEIEHLYNDVLNKQISGRDARKIHTLTNGWIMGIILASHPISGRSNFWNNSHHNQVFRPETGHMLDYFQDEIFDQVPQNLHNICLKLSFLHEIPAKLAVKISGIENIGKILSDFTCDNYFIYRLDDSEQVFRFHHFFQEFLQQRARLQISSTDIQKIYQAEAQYYLEHQQIEKALTSYKHAGDFSTMGTILKEKGMDLITKNKTLTILSLLQNIDDETLFQYRWLVLYSGLLRVDYVPQTTLPYWNEARKQFRETGEEEGELIALSQTIYFHFVISGRYRDGAELLPRTKQLLEKNKESFSAAIIIMAARNLSSGYCFFNGDMDKARHYIELASLLASRYELKKFIASTKFIQGYIELLSGNRAKYLREAEYCFSLFNDPLVGESNRLTMRVINLCYLSMNGDHKNFKTQQLALQRTVAKTVVEQTVAAPYLFVWGSSAYYSIGQPRQALELLEKGLGVTATASTDHMHSQLLQWKAFGLALTGYTDEARTIIEEATYKRDNAGGPFYIAFNLILAGAIYTRLKDHDNALIHLEKGLAIAQSIPSTYLTICGLFNRSYAYLTGENPEAALEDLEAGLSLMKINGYNHFWGWEPTMMTKLLGLAVQRDIEKYFAINLAKVRLQHNFSEGGVPIPLLKFTLLDSFELKIGEQVLFQAKDLTPFQRELLGLLLTAKGQRIPQEKIQLTLWPDSSPDNARKSFDTLLTRLRKLLSPQLPFPVKNYLYLQKGILCLSNYQIDALDFIEAARIGLSHGKNGDWWQAQNSFSIALSLWQGGMPEDIFQSEQALEFNDEVSNFLVSIATIWADNLSSAPFTDEVIQFLEKVLQTNPLEEELTSLLYRFHNQQNSPLKARETLARYKQALLKADYTEKEASDFALAIRQDIDQ
ncbi:MAG: LuxR family maltose regulon positive regulatory protein [Desulforhopalus sp.]|jgi:LuxR family maltose regulon positive regulatory protein